MYSKAIQNKKFVPSQLLAVIIFHILAIGAIFTFSWPGFVAFIVMTFLTGCLGITLGFHRLLAHRSFQTSRPLKYVLTFLGCMALQGGPVRWIATHRLHHKAADTSLDPHSSEEGFWWSHLLWNFFRQSELQSNAQLQRYALDIHKDPVLRWMDQHFVLLYLLATSSVFLAGLLVEGWALGLSLVLWGFVFRIVYVWHATWLVNSATHFWGYQTYSSEDKSRNTWWVAWLTFGEGWHNNHHVYPRSARMGLRWFEVDVTYWVISALKRLGLVRNVIRVSST